MSAQSNKNCSMSDKQESLSNSGVTELLDKKNTKKGRVKKEVTAKKIHVVDTNVFMQKPLALFDFEEHHVFVTMTVLEELDKKKKGRDDAAWNARETTRLIGDLSGNRSNAELQEGLALTLPTEKRTAENKRGNLFLFVPTKKEVESVSEHSWDLDINDHKIIRDCLILQKRYPEAEVILVTRDINARIKAAALEVVAEDYHTDSTVTDADLLPKGFHNFPASVWEHCGNVDVTSENVYTLTNSEFKKVYPHEIITIGDLSLVVDEKVSPSTVKASLLVDYTKKPVWGILAKNPEQSFAFNLLMNKEILQTSLLGTAGTGKTLLALAVGLEKTIEEREYDGIIFTRATVSTGEDIGFLPGTEEEKMLPWMGALINNLELLGAKDEVDEDDSYEGREKRALAAGVNKSLLMNHIKIRSLNFMRGTTFNNKYIIIDEVQNLTLKQVKLLISRAGPGCTVVLLGNLEQIDTPYLTACTCGLAIAVERMASAPITGHIILPKGERGPLADLANSVL